MQFMVVKKVRAKLSLQVIEMFTMWILYIQNSFKNKKNQLKLLKKKRVLKIKE